MATGGLLVGFPPLWNAGPTAPMHSRVRCGKLVGLVLGIGLMWGTLQAEGLAAKHEGQLRRQQSGRTVGRA